MTTDFSKTYSKGLVNYDGYKITILTSKIGYFSLI